MSPEHFDFVCEHFELRNPMSGKKNEWRWPFNDMHELHIVERKRSCSIEFTKADFSRTGHVYWLFENIPSKELAEEIIRYIKETEILFI